MKKREKTIRVVVNGVLLAAIAALGVTVYRTGSADQEQRLRTQQELAMQQEKPEVPAVEEPEEEIVDVDTEQVEAQVTDETDTEAEPSEEPEEADGDAEETAGAAEETAGDAEETVGTPEESDAADEPVSAIPTVNFTEETLMIWPLAGDILLDYSMDKTIYHPTLDVYKYNPAIVISAAVGSPVLAASNGTVASITENEETGTTVTLDMGNGYQAIYGQLQDIQVGEGQTVGESTILGYVAEPTKYYSVEGSNLYFAMRKDGDPLDPIAYLP